MRIAVVTLPLHTNYGGLLQAFALKNVLEGMGHSVTVLDLKDKMPAPKGIKAPFKYMGRILRRLVKGSEGPEVFKELRYRRELPVLATYTSSFVDRYISPRLIGSYKDVREGEYDAFIVGSDQVWRPLYFRGIEDAFLKFTRGWDVLRIAYAASFGTDKLEYEYTQLEECSRLLADFDAVSVREDAAVGMCEEWLDHDGAVHVLDPVMLPDADIYRSFASSQEKHPAEGRIMTYILDPSDEKKHVVEFMERVSGLGTYDSSVWPYVAGRPLSERVVPPVEQWLAAFADCEIVVTDSFHGCVLSVLMHKRFVAVGNSRRGMSRLNSFLSMFGLEQRLVHGIDPEDDGSFLLSDIDWERVDAVLQQQREKSLGFIKDSLKDKV